MTREYVEYNGTRVVAGWPEKIAAAQRLHTYSIGGVEHPRIRYGEERDDRGADRQPCHDCAVVKGQYHVPGCDVERCPVCDEQAAFCSCPRDDDEE